MWPSLWPCDHCHPSLASNARVLHILASCTLRMQDHPPLCLCLLRPPFASRFLFLFTLFALLTLFFEHHTRPALPPCSSISGAFFFLWHKCVLLFFLLFPFAHSRFRAPSALSHPPVLAAPVRQRNFISMSDDEDEARDDEDVWSRCVPHF